MSGADQYPCCVCHKILKDHSGLDLMTCLESERARLRGVHWEKHQRDVIWAIMGLRIPYNYNEAEIYKKALETTFEALRMRN